ncbi:pyruvate kinase [Geomesophilobacter sediminis]|uniref:Pyruvate kinase n=1 Tax=Geomesophilobacter sediminis TaxID=2798584 RepID=A0A8J7M2Y0_9BACT|nr:pyruvate kinase [Geomesophilobacter sediminis]MBJ6727763.1 pyruvate kinase [Geomesophilobacter sediminis]
MFRRTKIVATVGPASETPEMIDALITTGVDVFRLNFSHGEQEQKVPIIRCIRETARKYKKAVAILGDLQGPKIRVGRMKGGALELVAGSDVTITTRPVEGEGNLISTVYQGLPKDVIPGDRILLDDGLMELEVLASIGDEVRCQVITGGILKDRKGMNLPGAKISAPALTEKDREDLEFCIREELDYVALSFVREAADVIELKEIIKERESFLRVISKIEKPEAVANFEKILDVSDGIMVARGDLGVEINPEKVPLIQKRIIRLCNEAGCPVITATQMLESMVQNPRPTRAETSDVANAILDGTDAIMLSAETASGRYPIEAVSMMVQVARDIEAEPLLPKPSLTPSIELKDHGRLSEVIGQAACRVAEGVNASAILAFTQTGRTATLVSKYRPPLPIIAVTPAQQVRRRLALYAGVTAIRVDIEGDTESQILSVDEAVLATGLLKPDDVVVITMGSPLSTTGTTNLLKVHRLGEAPRNWGGE